MIRLEEVKNKKELLQDFFIWLFDDKLIINKSISLQDEVDFSLCSNYCDPNIYFPEQIKNFFDTKAMQRLGKISQLGLSINFFPNLYHSRLEHSKGVYNKKVEEFFYKYQDSSWKEYIENNNLKLYLIAELIKMAGHDIGHLPLSHALEIQINGKKGFHEEIGQRIMLENKEIQDVLSSISPSLNDILKNLYNNNFVNFSQHDESNYDVDRLDYLVRDSLYLGSYSYLPIQNYETICVKSNDNNVPLHNSDYSIIESNSGNCYIDVYDYSSLKEIEKALSFRLKQYKNVYTSIYVQTYEFCIKNFLDTFLDSDSNIGNNLKTFLLNLKNTDLKNLDLDEFINWNEINFYSELLDIAKKHENPNVRDLSAMIIPNMSEFLTLIYSHLNLNSNDSKKYSKFDKDFLQKIKNLIVDDSNLSTKLKSKDFFSDNILFLPESMPFLDSYEKGLINSYSYDIYAYKSKDPIYIKDKCGKIYELSHHPENSCDWNAKKISLHSTFANIPYLRYNGVSEDLIDKLEAFFKNDSKRLDIKINDYNTNMSPLQTNHNIEDTFLEI